MALIRTILALIIIVILIHVGASFADVEQNANGLTRAVFGLGDLLESPAGALINALPLSPVQQYLMSGPNGFYVTALVAAAGYLILYLLLGVGRRG